jgi:hypothetical protein
MPAQSLEAIAVAIRDSHEAAQVAARDAVTYAIRAGELLLKAKAECGHGSFGSWLAANVSFSPRTAQGYMRLASLDPSKAKRVADLSLRAALKTLSAPKDNQGPSAASHFSCAEMEAMSLSELDKLRAESLDVARQHFQAMLDDPEFPSAEVADRLIPQCRPIGERLIEIAARSTPEQVPLAMMLVNQHSALVRRIQNRARRAAT